MNVERSAEPSGGLRLSLATVWGEIVDVGDLPEGRGVVLRDGGLTVTITGLPEPETRELAKHFGQRVEVDISVESSWK
jgi:hypothetical protein